MKYYEPPKIHKALFISNLKEDPRVIAKGKRTTYCHNYIEAINVSHMWEKVTCEDCKRGKK